MDFYTLRYKGKVKGIRVKVGSSYYDISVKALKKNGFLDKVKPNIKGSIKLYAVRGSILLSRREIAGLDKVDDISSNNEYIQFLFRQEEVLNRVGNLKREYHCYTPNGDDVGVHICGRYIEQRINKYLMKLILIDEIDIKLYGDTIYVSTGYLDFGGSKNVKGK